MALSPDGRQLITGGFKQPLRWWDLQSKTNFMLQPDGRRALFSPDSRTLGLCVGPDRIEVRDAVTKKVRMVLISACPLEPLAVFSSDGHLLAAASDRFEPEQSIQIWDTEKGTRLGACIGHKQGIWALAFSPDSRSLASASDDNSVKLWNSGNQQELLSFPIMRPGREGLLFSPDGQLLLVSEGGREPGIRLLRAPGTE